MRVVSKYYGKYRCPYCQTVVELQADDIRIWGNSVIYFRCPTCDKTPHLKGGNIFCPSFIEGKKAKEITWGRPL